MLREGEEWSDEDGEGDDGVRVGGAGHFSLVIESIDKIICILLIGFLQGQTFPRDLYVMRNFQQYRFEISLKGKEKSQGFVNIFSYSG